MNKPASEVESAMCRNAMIPPTPPHAKTNEQIEASLAPWQTEIEARELDAAMKLGPWAEVDRLRKEVERLRACLAQVMQLFFEARAAAIEKPVRKPCKSAESQVKARRKTS